MESPRGSGRSGGPGGAMGSDSVEATPVVVRHSPHRLIMVHGQLLAVVNDNNPWVSTSCAMVAMITPQFESFLWPLWEGNAFKHQPIPGGWMRRISRKLKFFRWTRQASSQGRDCYFH